MRIGLDLVSISRIESFMQRKEAMERTFHPTERGTPEELAGIFAAKEAVFKALGRAPKWLGIEVQKKEGVPSIVFHEDFGVKSCEISITHEKGFAAAVAVIQNGMD